MCELNLSYNVAYVAVCVSVFVYKCIGVLMSSQSVCQLICLCLCMFCVLCVQLLFVHACCVCVHVIWSFTVMLTLGNNVAINYGIM